MTTVKLTHEINCDEATFWEVFLDKEFNEKLYREGLKFSEWSVDEQTDSPSEVRRKTRGKPKLENIPGPVAKLLGDSFGYTEVGTMNKGTKVWKWVLTPSTLADKVKQEGTLKIEPIGDKKVRRVIEMIIEAKIFMVGGMVESTTEKQMRDGWDASAVFMNKWLETHKK